MSDRWSETAHWTLRTVVSVICAAAVFVVLILGLVSYNNKVQHNTQQFRTTCVTSGNQYISGNCIHNGAK